MVLLGPICAISVLLAAYANNDTVVMIYDTLSLYLMCCNKSKISEYLMVIILNIVYQMISLFIRNLGIQCSYYGLTISIIYMIDYYIMLIMTYLYLKKGDMTLCSIVHHFGSYLATKLWKKRSENYSNKEGN